MSQRLTVELSDEIYSIIQREAIEANVSPAEVASVSLDRYFREQRGMGSADGISGIGSTGRKTRGKAKRTEADLQVARERFERHFGSVDLGYATGTDNEEIDADLARAYANANIDEKA
jgi:hypothetical protein